MSIDRDYARLLELGQPTVETSEVAAALKKSTAAATMLMRRLERSGLAKRAQRGLWFLGTQSSNRYALAERLTAPYPSYISLLTALYVHGMIEQIPAVVYAVSLARTQRRETSLGVYSIHHVTPELFDGFELRGDGVKMASAEKALFDVVYLSAGRSRLFAKLPELELPKRFRRSRLDAWIARIGSPRRRSMVETRLDTTFAAM